LIDQQIELTRQRMSLHLENCCADAKRRSIGKLSLNAANNLSGQLALNPVE
jgi:hypothetical protein